MTENTADRSDDLASTASNTSGTPHQPGVEMFKIGGERDQNRPRWPLHEVADEPCSGKTVYLRQPVVDEDHVVAAFAHLPHGGQPVSHDVNLEPGRCQLRGEHFRLQVVVFHDQYANLRVFLELVVRHQRPPYVPTN